MRLTGTVEIKDYVRDFIHANKHEFEGKKVIDVPAGSGITTAILNEVGADVEAIDLFPELFKQEGLTCHKGDLQKLPLPDAYADYIICQEGIEHVPNQIATLQEFNRVLKPGGKILITTPSYSNLRSRLSFYLTESEYFIKIMPPNELDSIWFSPGHANEVYYGHIFPVSFFKLRMYAKVSGLRIAKRHSLVLNKTALLLFVFAYPFIFLANLLAYRRAMRKNKSATEVQKKAVYGEILRWGNSPALLLDSHLIVELVKEVPVAAIADSLKGRFADTNFVT